MRIAGLATGMDINQMVTDLMRAERIPLDKMKQNKQVIEWKMADYREINRKLSTFHTNIFDGVMRSANMMAKTVTSSNSNVASATALSSASNVSLRLSNVTQLARAASYSSSEKISTANVSATGSIGSQPLNINDSEANPKWKSGVVNKETFRQTAKSETVSIGRTDIVNVEDMVVKVNGKVYSVKPLESTDGTNTTTSNTPDSDTVIYDKTNGTLQFNEEVAIGTNISTTFITDVPSNLTPDELNNPKYKYVTAGISAFDENGDKVEDKFIFTSDQSLNTIFTEVGRSSVGVSGFFDEQTGKVNISRTQTGTFNPAEGGGPEIIFEGFFKDTLNLHENLIKDGDKYVEGINNGGAQNAIFTLNGLETKRQSNTFTVSGVTINLKGTTAPNEVINLTASTDTDKAFDTIKKFVDEYNELLDFVNGKMTEERFRDYKPLTDEEKDALSEKEVERWEERARSGLLRNDATLRNQFDRMRVDMYSPVNGALDSAFKQLSAIGITTTSNYMDRGKLEINEDKLRAAIEQDAEGVFQMFTADGPTQADKGIARRVRATVDGAITSLAETAGGFKGKIQNNQFTLGRNMNTIDSRISDFERRLQQVEDRYWRQFNAMDAAVNKANQQAETLFAQLMPQG